MELTLQGRRIEQGDLVWLQSWIDENPDWSPKQIARELCRRWNWVDMRGGIKDFAARSLLLKLEGRSGQPSGGLFIWSATTIWDFGWWGRTWDIWQPMGRAGMSDVCCLVRWSLSESNSRGVCEAVDSFGADLA